MNTVTFSPLPPRKTPHTNNLQTWKISPPKSEKNSKTFQFLIGNKWTIVGYKRNFSTQVKFGYLV